MSEQQRKIPRSVNIGYVRDYRTGGTHNVLEVCSKDEGVRFVMAQDSETAKERDKYKLRASLQSESITELQAENAALQNRLDYHEAHPATVQRRLRKTEEERDALIEAARKFADALDKYVDDDCTKPLNLLHTQRKVRELLPALPTTPTPIEVKDSKCLGCGGSGVTGAPYAADTPPSMRPIGCCTCHHCHGTGKAPDWSGTLIDTDHDYELPTTPEGQK